MSTDIIVLAAVAIFVLLRLYGTLGQNIGHREDPSAMRDATFDSDNKVIELTPKQLEHNMKDDVSKAEEEAENETNDVVRAGTNKIRAIDRSFRMKQFLEGAKLAYEMVLESFSNDDRDTLKSLMSREVYEAFSKELHQRKEADEFTDTTLISILEADPVQIDVLHNRATITVRFLTEQIQVARKKDGEAVKDSTSAIEQVEDEWTFTKDLRSTNPNWEIIET